MAVYASDAPLAVSGFVRSVGPLARGAEVDLDAVVDHDGHGQPVTLEHALGPHLAKFTITGATSATAPAPVRGDEDDEA